MRNLKMIIMMFCMALMLNACAFDVVKVEQIPSKFKKGIPCDKSFMLSQDIEVDVGSGYRRTLRKGTRWYCVGEIEQGLVFKTKDQILTVEASNIYEANIVISVRNLVGYYLPVEHSFSPLASPKKIMMEEIPTK